MEEALRRVAQPFDPADSNNKVGAPLLRSEQEPALSLPKGRVPRAPAVTLFARPDFRGLIFVRRSTLVQMMRTARSMRTLGHDKPHDIDSIAPALAQNARPGHPRMFEHVGHRLLK